jgi:hypothetical protein
MWRLSGNRSRLTASRKLEEKTMAIRAFDNPMGTVGSMTTPALQKGYDKVWQGFDKAQF